MQWQSSWQNFQNILCIRLDNMGDVLMTTPAMRALKKSAPDRRITLLTSKAGAVVSPLIPEIDETIVFDVPWVKTEIKNGQEQLNSLTSMLAERQFDAAVIFTVYSQNPLPTAMLCYMAGIKNILGYCRENPYELIDHWLPDPEPLEYIRHEVDRQLDLVAKVGAKTSNINLSLSLPQEVTSAAKRKLKEIGVDQTDRWILMHTGVSEEKRLYPAKDYISVGKQLAAEGYKILLTGSPSEKEYVQTIASGIGEEAYNVSGFFTVEQLCAVIKQAPLLISNNTGPVHIAAAVGTPVVVAYAMTNPQHTPWLVPNKVLYFEVPAELKTKNRLLQSFSGKAEPKASPEAILKAAKELLGEEGRSGAS